MSLNNPDPEKPIFNTKKFIINLMGIILVLGLVGGALWKLFTNPGSKHNNVADIVKIDKAPAVIEKDKAGQTHAIKQVLGLTKEQARLLYKDEIDSLVAQNKYKDKQITGLLIINSEMETKFRPTIKDVRDSSNVLIGSSVDFSSKWLTLRGDTYSGKDWYVGVRDSSALVFRQEEYGAFKLKSRVLADIHSANKDFKYENLRGYQLVPEQKNNKAKIGFGVTIGPGLQLGTDNKVSFGWQLTTGLQYRF